MGTCFQPPPIAGSTKVTSLLEGRRLDSVLHPFPSELVPGLWLSHFLGFSPGGEAPAEPKAYVTVAASLVSELQTIWALNSLGETIGKHADMAIQPSKGLTLQEAKPWQATHPLGQVWRDLTWDVPVLPPSFLGTSSGNGPRL